MFNLNRFIRWNACFGSSCGKNGVVLENCIPTSLAKMPPSLLNCLSLTVTGRPADVFQSRHPDTAARCFYTCSCFNVSNCFHIFFFFICITRLLIFCWNFVVQAYERCFFFQWIDDADKLGIGHYCGHMVDYDDVGYFCSNHEIVFCFFC